ncbi:hypothetical protein FRC12_007272 [Ceratobasidium sp. 428]|nr:hypothetical protein FRC12_007272 [Ceratobasidium sp. 428]
MSNSSAHTTSFSNQSIFFQEEDLRYDKKTRPGYFPAWLGQPIPSDTGRYVIVRKLGWGQFSNVWLARDLKLNRFVSLKILTCEATLELQSGRCDELRLLQKLAAERSHSGGQHVIEYYENFEFDGPDGHHCCIVTEVLGLSVHSVRTKGGNRDWRISLPLVKAIVKQVLLALGFIHESCNIVHTGKHISPRRMASSLNRSYRPQTGQYSPSAG